jgi:hypothetical protein
MARQRATRRAARTAPADQNLEVPEEAGVRSCCGKRNAHGSCPERCRTKVRTISMLTWLWPTCAPCSLISSQLDMRCDRDGSPDRHAVIGVLRC